MKIILIGCGKTKAAAAAPASQLYIGNLFKARRGFAQSQGLPWAILSAEHGLLAPDTLVAPYDWVITQMPATERLSWARDVWQDVRARWPALSDVEVHAGAAYVSPLMLTAPGCIQVEHPVRGMGIGQQLGYYRNRR